jgi:Ca-activated chloride channel family protein
MSKLSCLALVGLLVAVEVRAQQPSAGDVFRSAVEIIPLNVVVTDSRQKFVNGLAADDFAVFEDGVRQEVSYFAASEAPLDLAIVLDTSASMTERIGFAQQAAVGLLTTLRGRDRVMVVDVKETARIIYQLGADVAAASEAIEDTQASGGTRLFNSLYTTLKELDKERLAHKQDVRRQAIVMLSDGLDTSSLISFEDVLDLAKQSGIAVYTIVIKPQALTTRRGAAVTPTLDRSDYEMKSLAQDTGALAFFPTEARELKSVYGVIANDLANQYSIAYTPTNARTDGVFRRILVRVANRPDARARTRSGYIPRRSDRPAALR